MHICKCDLSSDSLCIWKTAKWGHNRVTSKRHTPREGKTRHLPPRLGSAGRCSVPWLGPGHVVVGVEMLQGRGPVKQKLPEGPPSYCTLPRNFGSLK